MEDGTDDIDTGGRHWDSHFYLVDEIWNKWTDQATSVGREGGSVTWPGRRR